MKKVLYASLIAMVLFACNKKEPEAAAITGEAAGKMIIDPGCGKETVTTQPVKVGETGMVLPVGTRLCFTKDELEIRVTLPVGFTFITKGETSKLLPIYATYTCACSAAGSACKVFYADGLGFGCLQSSCTGSCTGKFTYGGYTVDKIVSTSDKESFFKVPEVQAEVAKMKTDQPYEKRSVFGVSFFIVNDVTKFMASAKCDCEGTAACKLKTISIPFGPKIYFCEGSCNGCELTVS